MKYLESKFSVPLGGKQYGDNYDRIFKKKGVPHIIYLSGYDDYSKASCVICGAVGDALDLSCPEKPTHVTVKKENTP